MKTIKTLLATFSVLACVTLLVFAASPVNLSGTITDSDGNPLSGVTVSVKNGGMSVLSGDNGYYFIRVDSGDVIVFSKAGYAAQERTVRGNVLNVRMKPEQVVELEDVVEEVRQAQYELVEAAPSMEVQALKVMSDASYRTTRNEAALFMPAQPSYDNMNNEQYEHFKENRFVSVAKDPLSTFALEVDGASYSNVRRMLNGGTKPGADAVRVEELVNYFSYDYKQPVGRVPLNVSYETGACPWNPQHKLVRIGVKAKEIPSDNLPAANFVFLIDVSGSMWERLPLVKSSLKLLVNNLRAEDRIAIVAYAGAAGEVLPSTPGSDRQKIREALDNLSAGGSTAGGAGIQLAYKVARRNFIEGGNNRIILATDGDFNVGISTPGGLEGLVEQERKSGVFLTVLGYGMGNYRDDMVQRLAEKGNGNHAYIDNLQEANKVLVEEFGGTMCAVAKDVKIQVEFNPARVQSFRLVGYESRLLEHEDFNDDTKDAGEIGAGHSVTALYEIVPVGSASGVGTIDPLKYQPEVMAGRIGGGNSRELMTIKMRYKEPDSDVSEKVEIPVTESGNASMSGDFHFASAVAMFGQLLKDSDYKGDATYDKVIATARMGLSDDEYGYRREFVRLVETAKSMVD